MKTEEILPLVPFRVHGGGLRRRGRGGRVRSDALHSVDDNPLANRQPVDDGGGFGRRLPEVNVALASHVVLIDDIGVCATLIG